MKPIVSGASETIGTTTSGLGAKSIPLNTALKTDGIYESTEPTSVLALRF